MATITMINKQNVPVTVVNGNEVMGVFVTVQEALNDNLIGKFDLYLNSWDGVYAVHSLNADYSAVVGGNDGGHFVSLHADRKLMAFRKE